MIVGHDVWEREFDRIVGDYRKIRANGELAAQHAAARDTAVEAFRKLNISAGHADEILSRGQRLDDSRNNRRPPR